MKTKIFSIAFALLAGVAFFASCDKENLKEEELAKVPFKSISLTCGGETVEGVLIDDQNIQFTFNEAEDFTSATIAVELNKGYTMTYPTELTNVDLAATPVFNFTDKNNKVLKYYVKFSSNAFPIVDGTKIQITGLEPGEAITLDNTTKTITVKYDQEKMNYESVVLTFLEGALQEGVEVPADLDIDFTDGIEQTLVFKLGGDRPYTLKLDVSAYQKKQLADFAFVEESFKYNLPEGSPVKVYATNIITGAPVNVESSTKCDGAWDGNSYAEWLYGSDNPRSWEVWLEPVPEELKQEFMDANGYNDYTKDDIFCFPGDWSNDRNTMNLHGRVVLVLIDREKVTVDMEGNSNGVKLGDFNNLVVATGLNNTSNIFGQYLTSIDGQATTTALADVPYRSSILTKDGKLKFDVVAAKDGSYYSIPFQTDLAVDRAAVTAAANQLVAADNIAWTTVWGVRNGKALGINTIVSNDGTNFVSDGGVLGMGWSAGFYHSYAVVGTTYDNKIGILINIPGISNWDGYEGYVGVDNCQIFNDQKFNYYGHSLKQMLWLAAQLGWRDAACIGQGEYGSAYEAGVRVNGISVIQPSDAPWSNKYANEGADLTAGYVLTVDAK